MTAFEILSNYLMHLIVSMGLAICSTERNSADVCMCIFKYICIVYIYYIIYIYIYIYYIYICIILPHQRELLNSCCDS